MTRETFKQYSSDELKAMCSDITEILDEREKQEFKEFESDTRTKAARFGKRVVFEDIQERGRPRKSDKKSNST